MCYNALDRHVAGGAGDRVAMYWEGNDRGVDRAVTYRQLLDLVSQVGRRGPQGGRGFFL